MKILLIGTGNVATVLGKLCIGSGHQIIAVAGRSKDSGIDLAGELAAQCISIGDVRHTEADIYIIAVSDSSVEIIARDVYVPGKLVVHTAGSVSKEALRESSPFYGVLYPLQSLRKEMTNIPDIPFLIDGNNAEAISILQNFAASISPWVEFTDDEQRAKLHVAAVFVNNFCNHLYQLAEGYCIAENLNFKLLYPLIKETACRLNEGSPSLLQTGPAIRKDIPTLERHLKLLRNYPKLKVTYTRLSDSIMNP